MKDGYNCLGDLRCYLDEKATQRGFFVSMACVSEDFKLDRRVTWGQRRNLATKFISAFAPFVPRRGVVGGTNRSYITAIGGFLTGLIVETTLAL